MNITGPAHGDAFWGVLLSATEFSLSVPRTDLGPNALSSMLLRGDSRTWLGIVEGGAKAGGGDPVGHLGAFTTP